MRSPSSTSSSARSCRSSHRSCSSASGGSARLPASSGKTKRHRLNRGGDGAANSALHMAAVCRLRLDPPTRAYAARCAAEGLSKREILRCLKGYTPARPTTCSPRPPTCRRAPAGARRLLAAGRARRRASRSARRALWRGQLGHDETAISATVIGSETAANT